ncbi:MAG: hypothetical protein WC091_02095 [Sulfuricellaceae bacterium]
MKRITITISESTAQTIAELVKACNLANKVPEGSRNGFTSHGTLTPARLLTMLAEDVGMVITRPGSWEASNMHQVLVSHGYDI